MQMHNINEVNESFGDRDDFSSKEIDLALRQLIQKGLVELHFDGKEFCFSVTKKGEDLSDKIKDKEG